jgi:hypothetical protein
MNKEEMDSHIARFYPTLLGTKFGEVPITYVDEEGNSVTKFIEAERALRVEFLQDDEDKKSIEKMINADQE